MADTQELDESMIVGEGEDLNGDGDGAMMETETHLSGKIAKLEESLEARSSNGGGTAHDGAGVADQVRQLDERLQKLAYVLAQQNWNRA